MDKVVELVGGGSVINGHYPVFYITFISDETLDSIIMQHLPTVGKHKRRQNISWHI